MSFLRSTKDLLSSAEIICFTLYQTTTLVPWPGTSHPCLYVKIEANAILCLGIYPKELKTGTHNTQTLMFTAERFTIAKCGNSLNIHHWMTG